MTDIEKINDAIVKAHECKCPNHPKYKAVRKPRPSKYFPDGCQICWRIYKIKNTPVQNK